MTKKEQVSKLYKEASAIALQQVEKLARAILTKHPELDEFVMWMGAWFFTAPSNVFDDLPEDDDELWEKETKGWYKTAAGPWHVDNDHPWFYELNNFMKDWDYYLKLTGIPMRFTATGEKVTDW